MDGAGHIDKECARLIIISQPVCISTFTKMVRSLMQCTWAWLLGPSLPESVLSARIPVHQYRGIPDIW